MYVCMCLDSGSYYIFFSSAGSIFTLYRIPLLVTVLQNEYKRQSDTESWYIFLGVVYPFLLQAYIYIRKQERSQL